MSKLQVFAGKKTGTKKAKVDGVVSSGSAIWSIGFFPREEGCVVGSTITNLTNGSTATITNFVELFGEDFSRIVISPQIFTSTDEIFSVFVSEQFSDTEYTELDLFEDETVEITQNIKDFKDISKILADYTQSFKIPASKTNNRYFDHYYNQDIVDGFDARFRYDCILKLNGIDWKEGQIRLTDVGMKNGSADNYEITFFGNIVSLKSILGDDDLSVLDYLDAFNHPLSLDNTEDFLTKGADLVYDSNGYPTGISFRDNISVFIGPDIVYPFISHENRYYMDSTDSQPDIDKTRNLYVPSGQNDEFHGLLYTDLKPSIKIIHIIRAIEKKYSISFSDDFFKDTGSLEFNFLYLHCSGESGSVSKLISTDSVDVGLEEFNYVSGDGDKRQDGNTSLYWTRQPRQGNGLYSLNYYTLSMKIVPDNNSGDYSVKVMDKDSNYVYYESSSLSGSYTFSSATNRNGYGSGVSKPIIVISTTGGITSFEIQDFKIINTLKKGNATTYTEESYYTDYSSSSFSNLISFREKFLPKMKCIDFLTSLFNMFNIVAYMEDGIIVAKPINDFYSEGSDVDVTRYVDFSSYKISRSDIYSEINYKYLKPKSVFSIKSNELSSDDYGNESFLSNETTSFDGGKYDVKINFSNVIYEYIRSSVGDKNTGVHWGYSVSDSFSPSIDTNLIHCVHFGSNGYVDENGGYRISITDGSTYRQVYDLPFSPTPVSNTSGSTLNLNFGSEDTRNPDADNYSLFKKYHEDYILSIYNKSARRVKIDSYLPMNLVLSIKLNDYLVINGKRYRINSMKNNLTTGKTKLELLSQ